MRTEIDIMLPRHGLRQDPRRWVHQIFSAAAVRKGGVVRRAVRDVEREIGREAFLREVRSRGFHLLECGGQFIVVCSQGNLRVVC